MEDMKEIISEIEDRIKALGIINISNLKKSEVHILSAKLITLCEQLNRIAYMMLYNAEGASPSDSESFDKLP